MSFTLHSDLERDGIVLGQFSLSLLLLINDAAFPWFVLVPQREQLSELIDMTEDDYAVFWQESRALGTALKQVFAADKLNVAALGNVTPQLHVHHVVRYEHDAAWPGPIWGKQPLKPYSVKEAKSVRSKIYLANMDRFQPVAN